MNTDIIYRSVVKETKEEVLVYRTMFENYRDLRAKREFNDEDLENFISLSKILGFPVNISKDRAVQLYYDCINAELWYHSVYVGDIALIKECNGKFEHEIVAQNKVFRKWNNVYTDLENFERYTEELEEGKYTVINTRLLRDEFSHEISATKQSRQKILAFCQNKFKQGS